MSSVDDPSGVAGAGKFPSSDIDLSPADDADMLGAEGGGGADAADTGVVAEATAQQCGV